MDALSPAKLARLEEPRRRHPTLSGAGEVRRPERSDAAVPAGLRASVRPGVLAVHGPRSEEDERDIEAPVTRVSRDLKDALGRATQLPAEARQQFEGQLIGTLDRLDAQKSLADQVDRSGRLAELLAHVFASTASTGSAPEEFWHDMVFPLLYVGAPESFPPIDDEELEAYTKGVDPLFLFADLVPYKHPSVEGGLLETFPPGDSRCPTPHSRACATCT